VFAAFLATVLSLPLQHATDAQVAGWIAADLAAGGRAPQGAAERLAAAGLRDDLDLARELGGRVAGAGGVGVIVGVHDGTVVLHGRVRDEAQRERLLALAGAAEGVRGVESRLLLPDEAPPAGAADAAEPSTAPARSEPFDLVTSEGFAARGVVVHVADGLVTLDGLASSDAARRWATATAGRVPGVRAVRNAMQAREPSPEADRRVAIMVLREIEGDVAVQAVAPAVEVAVRDGVVRLTGTVRDELQRARAGALAAGLEVVFAVDNRLAVDPALVLPPSHRNQGFRTYQDR